MKKSHADTLADLYTLAEHVLSVLPQKKDATILALSGELGAGKTAFVQTLAKALGIVEHVTSPTFVIMKRYAIARHAHFHTLIHIDAYRIESTEELAPLRLHEIWTDPGNLVCIEWPERVADILPRDRLEVRIEHDPETGIREIVYGHNKDDKNTEKGIGA